MRFGIEWNQVKGHLKAMSGSDSLNKLQGSIVLLEGSEADMVRDKTILYDGYWVTGLDVVHQMHCLVRSFQRTNVELGLIVTLV